MKTLKGRNTIRKNGSVSGATGQTSKFIPRWRFDAKPDSTLERLEKAYFAGLDAVDLVEARALHNKTNGKFTREGARDNVLHYALHELIPNLHKARMTIRNARAEVAERKSKLQLEQPDKSDIAAAVRRMEIRSLLRQMPEADQQKYLTQSDKLSSEVVAAVLEMPPELSGVPKPRHEMLNQRALAARHGPEISEIEELEAAVIAAESTVELARDELRLEVGGINKEQFDALAAPIEKRHASPWLRSRGGEVYVIDLERKIERPASHEDLATGIFANNHADYVKQQTTT
jgi:hypothetical protein